MIENKKTLEIIENQICNNKIVLYMKGTQNQPECGFSNLVVQILRELKVKQYLDINVNANIELKESIKIYSKWPTLPQLYIKQNFIGGADIVRELYESGELKKMVE